ncbi:MAG TPA: hypothetical protein VN205_10325, partial [Thermomonas sp.]|nr:hypothetical protein [Thermomonas sp.]
EAIAAYDPNCGARTVRLDDALRKDAERYRWLREHFRFANDSMRELWFDPVLEPNDSGVPNDLDQEIDRAMSGANA